MHKLSTSFWLPFHLPRSQTLFQQFLVLKLMIYCCVLQSIISLPRVLKAISSGKRKRFYRGNINGSLSALHVCIMLSSRRKSFFLLHYFFVSFCLAKNCSTNFLVYAKRCHTWEFCHSKIEVKNWLFILSTPPIRAIKSF